MSGFNAYHYIALGCAAIVLSIIGAVIIFARSPPKRGTSKRAVERLRNLPGGKPLAPLPAASSEILLPVSSEVPPTLERTEPLEVQRTLNASQTTVSAAAQPTFEHAEPLAFQARVRAEVSQPVVAKVRSFIEHAEPLEVQPTAARPELPLPIGSKVWAVCKLGSVPKGTPGIVTGIAGGRFIWQSQYLCTFADNRKARARLKDIEAYNHAHSLQELEQPNLGAIQSRHMISRAQQLLSRRQPTHPAFAGKTKSS